MAKVVVWSSEALCRFVEYDCPTIHDTTAISDCAMSFVPCLARVARACTDELNVPYPGILLRLVVYGISWTSRRRRRDPSSQIPSHSTDKVCHCVSVQISQIFLSPAPHLPAPPCPTHPATLPQLALSAATASKQFFGTVLFQDGRINAEAQWKLAETLESLGIVGEGKARQHTFTPGR